MSNPTNTYREPGFYVMDNYAATMSAAYVSGPWEDEESAKRDGRERSNAADLSVYRLNDSRSMSHVRSLDA
jgi:hypothetical protein